MIEITPKKLSELPPELINKMKAEFGAAAIRIISKWTEQEWKAVTQLILALLNTFTELPPELKAKLAGGGIEGSIFAAEYGLFLAVWSHFEIEIEILLMRALRLSSQESSIVCGGLSFGSKIHMLISLLARDSNNEQGILLLKDAQAFADRNSFAHGLIHEEFPQIKNLGEFAYNAHLLKREIKYQYIVKARPLNIKSLGQHVVEFSEKIKKISSHFGISDDDIAAYKKLIADEALAHSDRAKRHHESLTNARTAKRKRRGLPPQPSQD